MYLPGIYERFSDLFPEVFKQYKELGATPDEINHVVLLSLTTTGFPNMIAALSWVKEVLDLPK